MSRPFEKYQKEIEFALESIAQAAAVVKNVRAQMVQPAFTKQDDSPVTVADFAAQALVAFRLKAAFPKDGLVGEENASALRGQLDSPVLERIAQFLSPYLGDLTPEKTCDWIDAGSCEPAYRFWTLDPIDGTKGFIRGDQYAVALALIIEGDVKVSVMACPNLKNGRTPDIGGEGTLAVAVRGEGAWVSPLTGELTWKRLKVSCWDEGPAAVMLRSFEKKHVDSPRMQEFTQRLGLIRPPILMDSLAKYLVLASGTADLLIRFPTEHHLHEWIWDQAAGTLIVEEAGGKATDLDGKPLDYAKGKTLACNRGILVSNGVLHARILEILKDIAPAAR